MEEVNNEVNEMALTELVAETIQETTFDYSDVSQEDKSKLIRFKLRKGVIIHNVIVEIGGDLTEAQAIYSNNKNGKFKRWVEEEYGMPFRTANQYLQAYDVLVQYNNANIVQTDAPYEEISDLGVTKLASLYKLEDNQRQEVIKNAPLKELNHIQVNELAKQVKEAGEYNENLLNEIRQKDEKIKTTEEQQKQLQQEKEQKDQEIADLKAQLKELEGAKVQLGAQVEPEVVEKVVEVEKIVEKEVIPEEVKEELEELRLEKKRLEQETAEKTQYIKQQDEKLQEKEDDLNNLKIDKNSNQPENLNVIDIGILFTIIKEFLTRASSYTLLKGQYEDIPPKTKKTLEDAIKSVEDWCMLMEQAVNGDFQSVGNNIIIESEND